MAMVTCDIRMFNIEMYTYQIKVPWVGGNVQLTHCQHSVSLQSRTSNPMQPIITCEWTLHRFSVNQYTLMWSYTRRLQWWRFKKIKTKPTPCLCFKIKVRHLAVAQTSTQVDKANGCLPSSESLSGVGMPAIRNKHSKLKVLVRPSPQRSSPRDFPSMGVLLPQP